MGRLASEFLRVEYVPAEGGRIRSIVSVETGVEFLLQAEAGRGPVRAGMDAAFRDGACAGVEECLPSVGRCGAETAGGAVPDHGDFWQLEWEVVEADAGSCLLCATGFSRPLRFEKRLELRGRVLSVNYVVENVGAAATSFLYACHPLLAVAKGDRVVLPAEVDSLRLYGSGEGRVAWPGSGLDVVLGEEAGRAAMLYTERLLAGSCGVWRAGVGQGIALRFDVAELPYLGVWLCYGGWPEEGPGRRQYAVALEPTTAACGTLDEAQRMGAAVELGVGARVGWRVEFAVSEGGLGLAGFREFVAG